MRSTERPTWEDLAPLLRGAGQDTDAVWAVMLRHSDFGYGAVCRVVRSARDVLDHHDGRVELAASEAHAWAIERLYMRIRTPPPGLPVSVRRDGSAGDAAAWFGRVWSNLARDWCKSQRRHWRRLESIDEAQPPSTPAHDPWDEGALRRLRTLIHHPEKSGVSHTHALAYLCLAVPHVVDRDLVELTSAFRPAAGSRSGATGLARTADETWTLIQSWRSTHANATHRAAARNALAWILRSTDDGDPSTWRTRAPAASRTATVTVGKWAIRCADVLGLPRAG